MSGHSKWATIKHKKGAVDKARGKLFAKLIRQVEVAAREGGGDLETNASLRTMYQKARDASVPLDTIERAIKRGTGELEGVTYEQITYEGYAPHGVAVLIDVLTDNRNRSGSDIRSTLKKNGGSIAEPGAVSWQFERKGIIALPRSVDEDDLMLAALDAGLEDLIDVRTGRSPRRSRRARRGRYRFRFCRHDDGFLDHRHARHGRCRQVRASGHRRARGVRRCPGRVLQLRHPRRDPADRPRPLVPRPAQHGKRCRSGHWSSKRSLARTGGR
jgi:YebC/PmpR family DNA-binding regulatory protein